MLISIRQILTGGSERSIKAKKNIIGGLFIKGFSIIVQLLLVPLTIDYLSEELYGVWITLSSLIIWISFFDIGITLGLKNRLAEALAHKNYALGKRLVSTTYFIVILIFSFIGILGEFTIPYIDWCSILNVSHKYNKEILLSIKLIYGCICIQMILNTITAVLSAYQKVALSSIFTPIGNALTLVVIFLLKFTTHHTLINLVSAIAGIPILVLAFGSVYFYSHTLKAVCPQYAQIDLTLTKNLFNIGLGFFFLSLQYVLIFQSINFLISYYTSPIEVTKFNITYRYLSVGIMIFSIVLAPFWPAYTDAYTSKDFPWMRRIYKKLSFVYLLALIALMIMTVVSPIIYKIWIGKNINIPWTLTILVAIYVAVYSWQSFQSNLLNGMGKVRIQVITSVIGILIWIILSMNLGKLFGAYGVITSVTVVTFMYSLIYTFYIRKLLN